jgi:superfamily II DNA or RNA helicase
MAEIRTYYKEGASRFSLTRAGELPVREAQLGALHAIGAHFSLHLTPVVVALPTGVGKTVVAAAAPFVIPNSTRVLHVVPTKVLRQDLVANLRDQRQLRTVSLVGDDFPNPVVLEVAERPANWESFDGVDAAVSIPNALSST